MLLPEAVVRQEILVGIHTRVVENRRATCSLPSLLKPAAALTGVAREHFYEGLASERFSCKTIGPLLLGRVAGDDVVAKALVDLRPRSKGTDELAIRAVLIR